MTGTPRWVAAVAVLPDFLYGVATTVLRVGPFPPLALLAAVVVALPLLAVVRPRFLLATVVPSALIAAAVSASAWLTQSVPTGAVGALGEGLLLGLPLWFAGVAAAAVDRFGLSFLVLEGGLLGVVMTRAAVDSLGGPAPASALLPAWYRTDGAQVHALALTLGHGLLPNPPLEGVLDPVFIGLALLAVAGLLLPMLRSPERDLALPRPERRRPIVPASRTLPPPVLAVREGAPTPAVASPGAGVVPVLGAAAGLAVVIAVAEVAPSFVYLVVGVGVATALIALGLLQRPRGAGNGRGPIRKGVSAGRGRVGEAAEARGRSGLMGPGTPPAERPAAGVGQYDPTARP